MTVWAGSPPQELGIIQMSGLYDEDGVDGPWIKHIESQVDEVAARPTVCCVRVVAERVPDGKMWRADLGELPSMKTVYTPKAMVWASSATKLDTKKAKAWCALQPQDDGCSKWVTVSVRAEETNPLEVAKSKAMKMRKLRTES